MRFSAQERRMARTMEREQEWPHGWCPDTALFLKSGILGYPLNGFVEEKCKN